MFFILKKSWCDSAKTWCTILTFCGCAAGYLISSYTSQQRTNDQTWSNTDKIDEMNKENRKNFESIENKINRIEIAIAKQQATLELINKSINIVVASMNNEKKTYLVSKRGTTYDM